MAENQDDQFQQENPDPNVYQPDQEEDDIEIDRRIRRAHERLKRMTMVGFPQINETFGCQDTLHVEGGFDTGWAINYIDCGKQKAREGPPPPPPDCCNRDVDEISTVTITGDFTMTVVGFETDSCSFTKTWTRIPHTDAFDGVTSQFYLYFGDLPTCQLFVLFNDPIIGHDLPSDDCSNSGSADTVFGSLTMTEFMVFPIDFEHGTIHWQFTVDSSESALSQSCSVTSAEFIIPYTSCDVSALLGTETVSNHCDTMPFGFEVIFDITGSVIFA